MLTTSAWYPASRILSVNSSRRVWAEDASSVVAATKIVRPPNRASTANVKVRRRSFHVTDSNTNLTQTLGSLKQEFASIYKSSIIFY